MIDHVGDIEYMGQTTNTPAALMVNHKHSPWIFKFESTPLIFRIKHYLISVINWSHSLRIL